MKKKKDLIKNYNGELYNKKQFSITLYQMSLIEIGKNINQNYLNTFTHHAGVKYIVLAEDTNSTIISKVHSNIEVFLLNCRNNLL